jgi:hypothetical protein
VSKKSGFGSETGDSTDLVKHFGEAQFLVDLASYLV